MPLGRRCTWWEDDSRLDRDRALWQTSGMQLGIQRSDSESRRNVVDCDLGDNIDGDGQDLKVQTSGTETGEGIATAAGDVCNYLLLEVCLITSAHHYCCPMP